MIFQVGDSIKFAEERQRYIVQAANDRYAVCTKPFNARKTVLYTVIDAKEGIRGTEDLVFGMGAETREQCEQMLKRLAASETAISHKNRVPLKIDNTPIPHRHPTDGEYPPRNQCAL